MAPTKKENAKPSANKTKVVKDSEKAGSSRPERTLPELKEGEVSIPIHIFFQAVEIRDKNVIFKPKDMRRMVAKAEEVRGIRKPEGVGSGLKAEDVNKMIADAIANAQIKPPKAKRSKDNTEENDESNS